MEGCAAACRTGGEGAVTDSCSCGYAGPQSHCHLCHTTDLTTAELLAHMATDHDVDLATVAVVDLTRQLEDFR